MLIVNLRPASARQVPQEVVDEQAKKLPKARTLIMRTLRSLKEQAVNNETVANQQLNEAMHLLAKAQGTHLQQLMFAAFRKAMGIVMVRWKEVADTIDREEKEAEWANSTASEQELILQRNALSKRVAGLEQLCQPSHAHQSHVWHLDVMVDRAAGLKPTDDTYVNLLCGGVQHSTKVKWNLASPTWGESFQFRFAEPPVKLKIQLAQKSENVIGQLARGDHVLDITEVPLCNLWIDAKEESSMPGKGLGDPIKPLKRGVGERFSLQMSSDEREDMSVVVEIRAVKSILRANEYIDPLGDLHATQKEGCFLRRQVSKVGSAVAHTANAVADSANVAVHAVADTANNAVAHTADNIPHSISRQGSILTSKRRS